MNFLRIPDLRRLLPLLLMFSLLVWPSAAEFKVANRLQVLAFDREGVRQPLEVPAILVAVPDFIPCR